MRAKVENIKKKGKREKIVIIRRARHSLLSST
jgi:hypothetical protein